LQTDDGVGPEDEVKDFKSLTALADETKNIQVQREELTKATKQVELAFTTQYKTEKKEEVSQNLVTAENILSEVQKLAVAAEKVRKEAEEKTQIEKLELEKARRNNIDYKMELNSIKKKLERSRDQLRSSDDLFKLKKDELNFVEKIYQTRLKELEALDAEITTKKCELKKYNAEKSEIPSQAPNEQAAATIPPQMNSNALDEENESDDENTKYLIPFPYGHDKNFRDKDITMVIYDYNEEGVDPEKEKERHEKNRMKRQQGKLGKWFAKEKTSHFEGWETFASNHQVLQCKQLSTFSNSLWFHRQFIVLLRCVLWVWFRKEYLDGAILCQIWKNEASIIFL